MTRSRNATLPSISRDLTEPLRAIRSASQAVRRARAGSLSRQQERMLRIITEESSALACLIEDLLDMAEIESGTLTLRFRRCSLVEVARASIERQRPRFQRKGVDLIDSLPARCPAVRADAPRLRQVFDYLLSNALKFTGRGGRVEIKLDAPRHPARLRPALFLSLCDTGETISAEDLPVVFDAARAGACRSPRTGGGDGLGLSFARFLVEAHGGDIRAEHRPGGGTVFLFSIPIQD